MARSGMILLLFGLAGRRCALPAGAVREIVHMAELTRPPGMPSALDGVLMMGRQAVPVLRLDRLFGFPETPAALYTPIVLLNGRDPLGLLVDSVETVRTVPDEAVGRTAAEETFNGCAEAVVTLPDGIAHLLAPSRLLLAHERRRIAEFRSVAERRLAEVAG